MNSFLRKLGIAGNLEQKMFWIFVAVFIASELLFGLKDTVLVLLPITVGFVGFLSIFFEWQDFFLSPLRSGIRFFGQLSEAILDFKSAFSSWSTKPLLSPPRQCLARA